MAGQLWGWGRNYAGLLGDNTDVSKSSPVQTITFGTNWSSVVCGLNHTGATKTDGTLWGWGTNYYGELGDNTTTNKSSPVQTVAGGTNWSSVGCGQQHKAAIKTDGTLWTWGYNNGYGALGDNTTTNKSSPVQTVAGGKNWSSVACAANTTAAIKTDGTLWLWGANDFGQLGDSTTTHRSSPVQTAAFGTNWSQVSVYGHAAAIKTDGTLWMWGGNYFGELGDNTTVYKSSPVQTVAGGNNWSSVACGGSFTAAIKTDSTLWMWGVNFSGNLGDNTQISKSSPVQTVAFATNWSKVALGDAHSVAIKKDGTLWTWGFGQFGRLGDNTTTSKSSPVQTIAGGTNWSRISAGFRQTSAIYENTANQLGINTQPLAGYNANKLLVQPKININDSAGSVVRIATNSVSVAVISGTATLSGTTTVTAVEGVATFTDLILTGSGAVTLRFTSSGLTQVDSSSFTVSLTLPIIPKRSEVSGNIPTSGQLNIGELAINIDDKRGFIKKSDGTVLNIFNGKVADGGTF
jgi:hypothetical protein